MRPQRRGYANVEIVAPGELVGAGRGECRVQTRGSTSRKSSPARSQDERGLRSENRRHNKSGAPPTRREAPVRLCLRSPGRTRTSDREVTTAYYPVDRGRYPLLTRQDSESPTEGAAAFNLAFPQPCTIGFRFLQSMSCTTHGCAQRERLIHEASAAPYPQVATGHTHPSSSNANPAHMN